jgi:hypothetical protein
LQIEALFPRKREPGAGDMRLPWASASARLTGRMLRFDEDRALAPASGTRRTATADPSPGVAQIRSTDHRWPPVLSRETLRC